MPVAEIEVGPVVEYWEVDGGAFTDFRRVHVAAEISGPEASEGFLAARRNRHAPEHRFQVDLDRLHPRFRQRGAADHARCVEFPEIAAVRDGIVEETQAGIGGEPAKRAANVGGSEPRVRHHAQDPHDHHVVRGGALDVERANLAGKGTPFARVIRAMHRVGDEDRVGLDPQYRIAHGERGIADRGSEADGVLGLARGYRHQREHRRNLDSSTHENGWREA